MTYTRIAQSLQTFLSHIPVKARRHRRPLIAAAGSLLVVGLIGLFLPQSISYNFGKTANCRVSPRILPQLSRIETKAPYRVERPGSLSIGRFDLYAHRLCANATAAPAGGQTAAYKERIFGWPFLGHTISLKTPALPAVKTIANSQPLPPNGELKLQLKQPDTTFTYALQAEQRISKCRPGKGTELYCKLEPLQLTYAQAYTLRVVRTFKAQAVNEVSRANITTLTPITVTATSIAPGAEVQQKPTAITLQTDKKLRAAGTPSFLLKKPDGTTETFPATAQIQDQALTLTFGGELPRKTTFEFQLTGLEAEDGSGLTGNSYVIAFSTSGGPKVTGTNISQRNVGTSQPIHIRFNQELLPTQDVNPLVSLLVGGKPHPVALSVSGNTLNLTPQSPLPLCAPFTIKVTAAVQSQYGISGDSAWSFNSRAICYTTFSIGSSVRGRAITAYQFGSGPNPIIYTGAMHGNEANSRAVMMDWFNDLNANPGRLGSRSLVVIPNVNPDGVASGSRLNANGIDLNRNFPAADWKSVVTSPESPQPTPAGGPAPLSEPESRAVAAYIQRVAPRLVFSFHSAAAVVEANEAGDSVAVASTYAGKSRYRAVPKSQSAPVFKYDTTGAMEDWMRDRLGRPAIVVELLSKTANEYTRNKEALWYTTTL